MKNGNRRFLPKKEKREKRPEWPLMIAHINDGWKVKMKLGQILSEKGYPFHGRDFKDLAHFASYYQEWGLMALYDEFLAYPSPWVKSTGYSLQAFFKCLPSLVDKPGWKDRARSYEAKLLPPIEPAILELFPDIKK